MPFLLAGTHLSPKLCQWRAFKKSPQERRDVVELLTASPQERRDVIEVVDGVYV